MVEYSPILYALASVTIVSLISLVGIFVLSLQERFLNRMLFVLVSLSAGALFGDAIIHLIPEALENVASPALTSFVILSGIITFLVFEKFLRWRHEHGAEEEDIRKGMDPEHTHIKPVGHLVLFSDGVHNFIDGVIIGASYLVSIEVGIATTIAIVLHEIPQEIGDFALLIHAGFTKRKALFMNFLTALSAILGTIFVLVLSTSIEKIIPFAIAFAAGSFLYIAGSDLIPEIHKTRDVKKSIIQFIAILVGIGMMFALLLLE